MRYSEMAPEERRALEEPTSFPLHVRFLGKVGTLTHGEVRFLVEHGVDFEVDVAGAHPGPVERSAERVARVLAWILVGVRALGPRRRGERR